MNNFCFYPSRTPPKQKVDKWAWLGLAWLGLVCLDCAKMFSFSFSSSIGSFASSLKNSCKKLYSSGKLWIGKLWNQIDGSTVRNLSILGTCVLVNLYTFTVVSMCVNKPVVSKPDNVIFVEKHVVSRPEYPVYQLGNHQIQLTSV